MQIGIEFGLTFHATVNIILAQDVIETSFVDGKQFSRTLVDKPEQSWQGDFMCLPGCRI